MQLKKGVIACIALIIINFIFFVVGYYTYLNPKLSDFSIVNIENSTNTLLLNLSKCNHATMYNVKIVRDDTVVYETSGDKETIPLTNYYPDYEEEVTVLVTAKNKNNETKESSNKYVYKNTDPSFDKNMNHYLSSQNDLSLKLVGIDSSDELDVYLYYMQQEIYKTEVGDSGVIIPKKNLAGYAGRIRAVLKNKENRILSTFNFYLDTPIVGKLKKLTPLQDEYETRWNDVTLTYSGGENANNFYVNLYIDDTLDKRFQVQPSNNTVTIAASNFKENTNYKIVLEAMYEDYVEVEETITQVVKIGAVESTNPVYVTHNPYYIKKGTKVSLKTMSNNAKIYYTLDGSEPNESSLVYNDDLVIDEDVTIKAYAHTKNRHDSFITTFNFRVEDKTPVIYLSPSNQDGNYGALNTGFTTEKEEMNKVADVVENKLKEAGFIVYRNYPSGDINAWTAVSNSVKADFHFAIHSNGSQAHTARGIEIFVDDENSRALSVAANIYENLWKIYPDNSDYSYHRGIKYARGSLGEVNNNFLPCGSLIEVAYHDNTSDALWIVNNVEEIGTNLANSIINYYS